MESDGLEPATDGFLDVADFQQGHAKGVPPLEKIRVDLHAPTIKRDRFIQFANGEVAVGVIEKILKLVVRTIWCHFR